MSVFLLFPSLVFLVSTGYLLGRYLERRQLWTIRLRLSLFEPALLAFLTLCSAFVAVFDLNRQQLVIGRLLSTPDAYLIVWPLQGSAIALAIYVLALSIEYHEYARVRWKAWCGPSRTGIPAATAVYIGGMADWKKLQRSSDVRPHSTERFSNFLRGEQLIVEDPTDLLRERLARDKRDGGVWQPAEKVKQGVYYPVLDRSVSLLWGKHLGFQERCTRAIISIPPRLLPLSPKLRAGHDGRAFAIALGILSRNKGLEPHRLICNLRSKNSFREWEEIALWPHPSKTLRSFYLDEFTSIFALIGESYVTAATELALLIEDLPLRYVERWLSHNLEHQDLALNQETAALGAQNDDLDRLYHGQYAAMLISLTAAPQAITLWPEIAVFDAICRLEGVETAAWTTSEFIRQRREAERAAYGSNLQQLVDALI